MIQTLHTSFPSQKDGLEIHLLKTLSQDQKPKAILQIAHGMSEHKERYLPFMEFMASQGIISVINDQRGHGESVFKKEDLGYMYGAGADGILEDLHTINQKLHQEYPGLPLILFGHSMGSLAVRAYDAKYDDTIDMLIVCGSPSKNSLGADIGTITAKVGKRLKGEKHRSKTLTTMALGGYARKFIDESPVAWISTDKEVQKEYENSDLCGFMFTYDGFQCLFDLMKRAYDVKNWQCRNPELPVLFISGSEDPCMVDVRHFSSALHDMRLAGYKEVEGKIYPGMRHEILNEPDHKTVYNDICAFIKKHGIL